ncbi:MAG: phosphohydrolase [Candidatus Omnitrophota bacterium]
MDRCPGKDKNLHIKIIRCPYCKYAIEFFSDEIKRICPGCKKEVIQEKLPSCIDWCKYAKVCLGETRFKELGLDKVKRKTK